MRFEPGTFFIGIIDFFSVMLPGAAVAYLIKSEVASEFLPHSLQEISNETVGWAVFLFASYVLGHFVFLVGSGLDLTYKLIRDATPVAEAKRVKEGHKPSLSFFRWLAEMHFPKDADLAIEQISKLKNLRMPESAPDVHGRQAINAFQWSKARLAIECPLALSEVQRFEADSKFFRSLVIVLLFYASWVSGKVIVGDTKWMLIPFCLILAVLAFWRYVERRFKSTQQAYWFVLTLEKPSLPRENKESP